MRRLLAIAISILLLISCFASWAYAEGSVPQDVLDSVDSVVRIIAEYDDGYATGSGFVIQSDSTATLIATNHHVIADKPKSVSIWTETGVKVAVTVLTDDPERDLCILQLPYPNTTLKAVVLDENGVKRGDAIYAVGFPGAADDLTLSEAYSSEAATITTGIVSAIRTTHAVEDGKEFQLLQCTAPINHGNSGGPLFNERGYVVGVNTYRVEDSAGIYGAIHISELIQLATTNGIPIQLPSKSVFPSWGAIIGAVAGVGVVAGGIMFFSFRQKRKKAIVQVGSNADTVIRTGPVADAVDLERQVIAKVQKKKLHIKPRHAIIAALALLAIAIGVLGFVYVSHYREAVQIAETGSFSDAQDRLSLPFITKLHDSKFVKYLHAGKLLEAGQFDAAKEEFTKLNGYKDADSYAMTAEYRKGIELLNTGEYDLAIEVFNGLSASGYAESDGMVLSVKYAQAEHLLQDKNYEDAISLFAELAKQNYKDASDRVNEAKYNQALDALSIKEYSTAYEMLKSLGDYSDAEEALDDCLLLWAADCLDRQDLLGALQVRQYGLGHKRIEKEIAELKDVIYEKAILLYRKSNNSNLSTSLEDNPQRLECFIAFYVLYPYERSGDYITLLKGKESSFDWFIGSTDDIVEDYRKHLHLADFCKACKKEGVKVAGRSGDNFDYRKYWPSTVRFQLTRKTDVDRLSCSVSALKRMIPFEDVTDIILGNADYTAQFLVGTWKTSDGSYYFTLKSDGNATYNLPWYSYGDYYRFENGDYVLYYEKDPNATRTLFSFQIVSANEIIVNCHKDGSQYRLYHQ